MLCVKKDGVILCEQNKMLKRCNNEKMIAKNM